MRIVSWNVNGLYTTLKDAGSRYASVSNYFSEVLKADIVCFQVKYKFFLLLHLHFVVVEELSDLLRVVG